MARAIRSAQLETRTARLKLPIASASRTGSPSRQASRWATATGPGTWNARAADGNGCNWIKSFAVADDHEDADGATRSSHSGRPPTKPRPAGARDECRRRCRSPSRHRCRCAQRIRDPILRRAAPNVANADLPFAFICPPSLMAQPVAVLTVRELPPMAQRAGQGWCESHRASTGSNKAFKAALNLAASHDDRIAQCQGVGRSA